MKQVLHNKKILAIAIVCLVVILSVVIAVSVKGKKAETVPESSTSEVVTSSETTTEEVTESTTESTTAETTTGAQTQAPETTTKKPVSKPETTTKKPVSKPETTTRAQVTTNQDAAFEAQDRQVLYWQYGGEEGYKAHLQEIANAKCPGCGNHNCPSMEYKKNRLGDIDSYYWNQQKCPNYGKTKCPHCGKILTDDSSLAKNNTSDTYCLGNCNVTFK